MLEKLAALLDRYNEINERLMQPEVAGSGELYTSLMKEYNQLTPIIDMYKAYLKAEEAKTSSKSPLSIESSLYKVNPILWSLTLPSGKL